MSDASKWRRTVPQIPRQPTPRRPIYRLLGYSTARLDISAARGFGADTSRHSFGPYVARPWELLRATPTYGVVPHVMCIEYFICYTINSFLNSSVSIIVVSLRSNSSRHNWLKIPVSRRSLAIRPGLGYWQLLLANVTLSKCYNTNGTMENMSL